MSQITLIQENGSGATVVPNLFIDRYMKDANDAQLKVYFYLLRSASDMASISISDIADTFNHTEKDVIRSLKYWERAGLLALDLADGVNITGIHLLPIPAQNIDSAPVQLAPVIPMVPDYSESTADTRKSNSSTLPAVEESRVPKKPRYVAADLRAFGESEDYDSIICMVETYLKITITPEDLKSLLYINKELSFGSDMIDELLQYSISKGKKDFKFIEKAAIGWYELGITTPSMVKDKSEKYDNRVKAIMKALGKSTAMPSPSELQYINRWIGTFGFSMEVIAIGCERTVLAVDSYRFKYADGIFSNWYENGVKTPEDVIALEKEFRSRQTVSAPKKNNSDNKFTKISKTNYDFAALEKDIISN